MSAKALDTRTAVLINQNLLPTCRELTGVSRKALAQCKDSKCLSTRVPVELKGAGSIKEKPKEGSKATRALNQCICTRGLNQSRKFKPWLSTRLLAWCLGTQPFCLFSGFSLEKPQAHEIILNTHG